MDSERPKVKEIECKQLQNILVRTKVLINLKEIYDLSLYHVGHCKSEIYISSRMGNYLQIEVADPTR